MPVFIPIRPKDYHEHPYSDGELFKGCPACERKLQRREQIASKKEEPFKWKDVATAFTPLGIVLLAAIIGLSAQIYGRWQQRSK